MIWPSFDRVHQGANNLGNYKERVDILWMKFIRGGESVNFLKLFRILFDEN